MHSAQNGGNFKIAPSNFSLIFAISDLFFQKFESPYFSHFADINSIFCTVTHDNDLMQWCDFRKDLIGVSLLLGRVFKTPPRNISRLNTPGLIGLML